MILLTGATGHLGRYVAEILSERGLPLRLLVRDASRVPPGLRADVRTGDYGDVASLESAFEDVETAFLVSASAAPGKRAELHANAFAAARDAGVRHVVYLSLQGSAQDSEYPFSRDHWESEEHLRSSGLAFTVLRNGKYTEQLLEPDMLDEHGVLRGPPGRAIAWISRRDSARVIATLLPEPPGGIVTYTGPEALALPQTAARLSSALGRTVRWEEETPEATRSRAVARVKGQKLPPWRADLAAGTSRAIEAGEYAPVHDAGTWIGRAERLEDTVKSGALDALRR